MHPKDYAAAEDLGEITTVVHSHPKNEAYPSEGDLTGIKHSKLPWVIVNPHTEGFSKTYPDLERSIPPLVGRVYEYGSADCFTVVQDYYLEELDLALPEVIRSPEPSGNNILEHFKAVGFEKTVDLQLHDLIVMQCDSSTPNHLGVYLGDGYILHHCVGRLSSKDVYGDAGYWYQNTWGYLRHVDLI